MPLLSNAPLSPHFAAWELGADKPGIPDGAVLNLSSVAAWLESARAVVGGPLVVNTATAKRRGWRSEAENIAVGGSPTSDHVHGLAADFSASSVNRLVAWTRLRRATLPAFDQLIFYPIDGHFHVGLGSKLRRQYLIALREGGYQRVSGGTAGATTVLLLVGAVLLLMAIRLRRGA